MMRSMYSAVSGLRVHQTKMDVIGNNIANINTVGYKRQSVTFQEVFSEVIRGASAPQGGRGGTNPQQIGLGVSVGSINTIHTKGAAQRTDNPEDLMIDGEGFFVVSADPNLENRYYTRAGNFTLDRDGNLVTADGYKVLGYRIDENGDLTSEVVPIQVMRSETVAPTATSRIEFRGNLNSNVEVGTPDAIHRADTIIKDSLGNSYTVTFRFTKVGPTEDNPERVWTLSVERITNQSTGKFEEFINENDEPGGNVIDGNNIVQLVFDENGKLIGIKDASDANVNRVSLNLSKLGIKDGTFGKDGSDEILLFDVDNMDEIAKNLTQYANDMDAKPYALDGNTSGKLEGYAIDASGTVVGIFSNGEMKELAQLMLAKFDNPMGLQKMGGNLFIESRNSGEPQYGVAASGGYGTIAPGTLEMSNVDLSMEFTEMITTQRGFQANSRIITASDEMLQELVNLKR